MTNAKSLNIISVCRTLPSPTDPSGGIFVRNRLAAMAAQACVQVIQPVPYFPFVRPLPSWASLPQRSSHDFSIRHAPMFYVPGALKSLDSYWLRRAVERQCAEIHRMRPVDLMDAHFGYPEGVGCSLVAQRLGVPLFITIRGFEAEFIHRPRIGAQLKVALSNAAGIVAVSHSLLRLAVENGVSPDRVTVIHNAIDSNLYKFGDRQKARGALGLSIEGVLVVSVGHLVPRKRHHVLLKAFSKFAQDRKSAKLVIIGSELADTAYAARLRQDASNLGIAHSVMMLGNLEPERVVDWLQAADLFALATAREGCCNAVLEALAVGTPVVTTPVGDNAAFVRDGVNGFLVPVDDSEAMSAAISQAIVHHAWDRPQIARQLAAQVGGWRDVAAKVLKFFGERLRQV